MTRIRVALFNNRADAEPIQTRLMRAGIQAEIHDELRLAKLWFVSKRTAGVRIEIPAREFKRCQEVMLERDVAEEALRKAIRCPECKSLRVDYPQVTEKSLLTNLAMGLIAELGLVEKEYYCEDCHFMWARESLKCLRPRLHMAPNYFIEDLEQPPMRGREQPEGRPEPKGTGC